MTVIVGLSPVAVPAAPENVGVVSLVLLPLAGLVRVRLGAIVSTVNLTPGLVEVPLASVWTA